MYHLFTYTRLPQGQNVMKMFESFYINSVHYKWERTGLWSLGTMFKRGNIASFRMTDDLGFYEKNNGVF